MEYNELLLSAAVRELASTIRTSESNKFWRSLIGSATQTEQRDKWERDHPINEFVPEALDQLLEIAEIIRAEIR